MKKGMLLFTGLLSLCTIAQGTSRMIDQQELMLKRRESITQVLPGTLLALALWQARQTVKDDKGDQEALTWGDYGKLFSRDRPGKIWRRLLRTFKGGERISNREKWFHRLFALAAAGTIAEPWRKRVLDRGTDGYLWPRWRQPFGE